MSFAFLLNILQALTCLFVLFLYGQIFIALDVFQIPLIINADGQGKWTFRMVECQHKGGPILIELVCLKVGIPKPMI